jgi:hypothetical protein
MANQEQVAILEGALCRSPITALPPKGPSAEDGNEQATRSNHFASSAFRLAQSTQLRNHILHYINGRIVCPNSVNT